MRLCTLRAERPDGRLHLVSFDGLKAAPADAAPSLLAAIEDWARVEPGLRAQEKRLASGGWKAAVELSKAAVMAPLPRTWAWLDGSAFIQHIVLVRRARGAEPPRDLKTVPLMYQGVSDHLLGPRDDIPLADEAHGLDFEGEVAVILDEVPMGTKAAGAGAHIRLLMVMNDVSLRSLIPRELAAGFGFFQSKPASSFSPLAVTPDELGDSWKDGRLHLELRATLNGRLHGRPDAGEMHFSFHDLIEHAARTRVLPAGTILGSGAVSNADESAGSSCLAETRMLEKIKAGAVRTPFLKPGDRVEMEMFRGGRSVFGKISQEVVGS